MALFRNGNRVIEGHRGAFGAWVLCDGVEMRVLRDEEFRTSWEPADEEARRMWRGGWGGAGGPAAPDQSAVDWENLKLSELSRPRDWSILPGRL